MLAKEQKIMLTIAHASDLHFEFRRQPTGWMPPLSEKCDLLILAGDIAVGNDSIEVLQRIAAQLPATRILWIAGNHEFYYEDIDEQIERYRQAFRKSKQIDFLENNQIEINGYTFLGCTLWTDFSVNGKVQQPLVMQQAQQSVADFRLIRKNKFNRHFSAEDAADQFQQSYRWLEQQLANADPDKTIVITHFPPSPNLSHGAIGNNLLTPYFQANGDQLIKRYQPRLWIYGHNHWSDRKQFGETVCVSNQLGYPQEAGHIPAFSTETITL